MWDMLQYIITKVWEEALSVGRAGGWGRPVGMGRRRGEGNGTGIAWNKCYGEASQPR